MSSAGVSLVVPLLSVGSEGRRFSESLELEAADRSDSLDERGESIDGGSINNGLLFLSEGGVTLGVSLTIPLLALVTYLPSCLG